MERKTFERGTVTGGIVRIAVCTAAFVVASVILVRTVRGWDSEEPGGRIFMCAVCAIFLIASVAFFINGLRMISDGRKSFEVARKGHAERGRILNLSITEVKENNNGAVSRYLLYLLKFEYTDDSGNLCESSEQISERIYKKLEEMQLVPILVLGERAVFDKKRFEEENFMNN